MKYVALRGFFLDGAWVNAGDTLRVNQARGQELIRSRAAALVGKAAPPIEPPGEQLREQSNEQPAPQDAPTPRARRGKKHEDPPGEEAVEQP